MNSSLAWKPTGGADKVYSKLGAHPIEEPVAQLHTDPVSAPPGLRTRPQARVPVGGNCSISPRS